MKCCKKKFLHFVFVFLLAICMTNLKSTCKAYTIDDVKFFIDYLYSQNVTNANYSSFHNRLGSLRNDWERMLQKAREQNIDLSQYTCWRAASTGRSTSCHLFGFKTSPEYHCTGYWYETTNTNSTYPGILWTTDLNSWDTGNYRFSDDFCALNENEPTNGNYYNAIMQNKVEFPPNFKFTFFDERITATAPNGATAYCVFLNDLTDIQGIGYIENYEEHPDTQITIFMQNYRDPNDVKVQALQPTDYELINGELWVKTITMWTPMVYEIVGIDGDDNFIAYYYIAAGSNTSGDPNFYGTPPGYDDNQFFLWKLLGNFGDDSGDKGGGLFGGLYDLFIPDKDFFLTYFNNFHTWASSHLGLLYTPFEFLFNLLDRIINADYTDPMVEIGPYTLPLFDDFTIVPKITYHFNDLLQDENMSNIHDIYLLIVDGILIIGFLRMCYNKYEEIIGGKK